MIKVGDEVVRERTTYTNSDGGVSYSDDAKKSDKGTVVFVHPKGRFHTVEFRVRCGILRECFAGV